MPRKLNLFQLILFFLLNIHRLLKRYNCVHTTKQQQKCRLANFCQITKFSLFGRFESQVSKYRLKSLILGEWQMTECIYTHKLFPYSIKFALLLETAAKDIVIMHLRAVFVLNNFMSFARATFSFVY